MVVVGSGIMAENLSSNQLDVLLANTIATGAGLTVLIWIFISTSGAHFNPAVSFIMFLKKGINPEFILPFILFQIIGACVAMFLMKYLLIGEIND